MENGDEIDVVIEQVGGNWKPKWLSIVFDLNYKCFAHVEHPA